MLENAGEIQHCMNLLAQDGVLDVYYTYDRRTDEEKMHYCIWYVDDFDGESYRYFIEKKVWMFFMKGRCLRSDLASPMARYYAWQALEARSSNIK